MFVKTIKKRLVDLFMGKAKKTYPGPDHILFLPTAQDKLGYSGYAIGIQYFSNFMLLFQLLPMSAISLAFSMVPHK